jgi:hypothetical protein
VNGLVVVTMVVRGAASTCKKSTAFDLAKLDCDGNEVCGGDHRRSRSHWSISSNKFNGRRAVWKLQRAHSEVMALLDGIVDVSCRQPESRR